MLHGFNHVARDKLRIRQRVGNVAHRAARDTGAGQQRRSSGRACCALQDRREPLAQLAVMDDACRIRREALVRPTSACNPVASQKRRN